jgi:hypothetical protein
MKDAAVVSTLMMTSMVHNDNKNVFDEEENNNKL